MRNNDERSGARHPGESDAPKMPNPMDFVTPTEFIELPSKGAYYPVGHPLHNQQTLEIRFMTAKDEDILTSRALLKKGVALDRLINNLIVDKTINGSSLLIGDRNAIIIAARSSAYGHIYETTVACPACGEKSKNNFDLTEPDTYHGGEFEDYDIVDHNNGEFSITLPLSKVEVQVKLLNGNDETRLLQNMQRKNKNKNAADTNISDQLRTYVVSVNGYKDPKAIRYLIDNITARDSRYLRNAYSKISPDLKISDNFECLSCGHEQELEVPFGADFFWPDR